MPWLRVGSRSQEAARAGQGARLPSQRRFAARAQSLDKGVTLTRAEMDGLEALAAR